MAEGRCWSDHKWRPCSPLGRAETKVEGRGPGRLDLGDLVVEEAGAIWLEGKKACFARKSLKGEGWDCV